MQIVITLNSEEELIQFLENMKKMPAKAEQKTAAAAPVAPAIAPQMTSVSATTGSTPAPVPAASAPAPWKTVTRQDVQTKAIALMDAGKQTQLQALLMKYKVPALPSIPEDQLAAFMADLEVL
jgi:hypothetical protein